MDGMIGSASFVRGVVGRKLNNALTMEFQVSETDTVATAVQGGGDGKGSKLATLFGFKNGGTGTHVLTGTNGRVIQVESREMKPTIFRDGDGAQIGEAIRDDETLVNGPDGQLVFKVIGRLSSDLVPDAFRTQLVDPTGAVFGSLDVIRRPAGWALGRDLVSDVIWFGHAGQPLKIPLLGTNLAFDRPPTALEGDIALAVCLDLAIGMRPYVTEMK